MMNIFKSDPISAAEAELASWQRREQKLRARVAAAEGELTAAEERRRLLAIEDEDDGDDVALELAHSEVTGIAGRVAALRAGLDELVARREGAERTLAQARDKVERERVAGVMSEAHGRIDTATRAFVKAAGDMVGALAAVSAGEMLTHQVRQFADGLGVEVSTLLRVLDARRGEVLAGIGPIPVIAERVPIAPPAPAIKTRPMFALKQLAWTDADGVLQTCIRHAVIDLPPQAAERGLALGVVFEATDPRAHTTPDHFGVVGIKTHGTTLVPLPRDECVSLDPSGETIEGVAA